VFALILASMSGCSSLESFTADPAVEATSQSPVAGVLADERSPSEAADPESPVNDRQHETQPGVAEAIAPPSAEVIEGCDASTCSVSDAVVYEHLYRGSATVLLFADYSEDSVGVCKVAILDHEGATAQILPFQGVGAWSMRDQELKEIYYFLSPPTDSTGNVFIRVPSGDGLSASGLSPASTGYFELFDLSYVFEEFGDQFNAEPMVGVSWGDLDRNGNYRLMIEDAPAEWDGKRYSAL
jgi:hypothetical protein